MRRKRSPPPVTNDVDRYVNILSSQFKKHVARTLRGLENNKEALFNESFVFISNKTIDKFKEITLEYRVMRQVSGVVDGMSQQSYLQMISLFKERAVRILMNTTNGGKKLFDNESEARSWYDQFIKFSDFSL